MESLGTGVIVIAVLAVAAMFFHIVIIALGVAHGLTIYERRKRERRQEARKRNAQKERQEKYNREHPSDKGFYSGGVRYVD